MIPRVQSRPAWDGRRNTSAVQPVPPTALREALASLYRLRRDEPALVKWIEDGHPNLTEADHLERFGEPYRRKPRKSQA